MAGYIPLPAPQISNAMVDFSPINSAIDDYSAKKQQNAMFAYRKQQDALQNARADAQLGMQRERFGMEKKQWQREQAYAALKRYAGVLQAIEAYPPDQRQALYARARQSMAGHDPEFEGELKGYGVDANDYSAVAPFVYGIARGYQDPLARQKAEAEIANTRAQTEYYNSQANNKDATARYKTVDNRLVRINDDGSATEVYRAQSGSDDPKVARNIAGGLERLRTVPGDMGESTFESAVGPLAGGDTYFFSPLARVWGAITNVGGERSTTEVRNRIAGDTEALAASIKPLIRKPGEGTWTDADQARLVSIVGNLASAQDAKEYQRALEGVRQRVMQNFGIQLPELGGGQPVPAEQPRAGGNFSGMSDDDLMKYLRLR